MIRFEQKLQCLRCDRCGQRKEVTRRKLADPEIFLQLMEEMAADHETCQVYRNVPAARVRVWRSEDGPSLAWPRLVGEVRRYAA